MFIIWIISVVRLHFLNMAMAQCAYNILLNSNWQIKMGSMHKQSFNDNKSIQDVCGLVNNLSANIVNTVKNNSQNLNDLFKLFKKFIDINFLLLHIM